MTWRSEWAMTERGQRPPLVEEALLLLFPMGDVRRSAAAATEVVSRVVAMLTLAARPERRVCCGVEPSSTAECRSCMV